MVLRTEILRYVDEKGEEGCSWSELEIRFVSKSQLLESLKKRSRGKGKHSKGAFVNAMKDLQRGEEPLFKKILVKGNPRYVITLRGKSELGKKDLTQVILAKELIEIEFPTKPVEDFFFNRIKAQVDVIRHSNLNLLKYLKLSGKKGEFYGKFYARFFAQKYAKRFVLNVAYPKGENQPNLDVKIDAKNKTRGLELLLDYFTNVAGNYEKKTGEMLPVQLFLSYEPPVEDLEEMKEYVRTQFDSLYQKWLSQFKQKDSEKNKERFKLELVDYIPTIHNRRLKALGLD